MNDKRRLLRYFVLDWLSALLAWVLFNVFRFNVFRSTIGFGDMRSFLLDDKAILIGCILPFFWTLLYYFSGYYHQPRRKTNTQDSLDTAVLTLIGVLLVFFAILVDDYPEHPALYYKIIVGYCLIHGGLTWLFRRFSTGSMIAHQRKGEFRVPVLIVGSGIAGVALAEKLGRHAGNSPYKLVGCVTDSNEKGTFTPDRVVGTMDNLSDLIQAWNVEELILAIDDRQVRHQWLKQLFRYRLSVKAEATEHDIVSGYATLDTLFGVPMVNLTPELMPYWQQSVKAVFDRGVALISLIVLIPLCVYLAVRVRLEKEGPVLYKQERVGKNGRLFCMYKFRTMYPDAEKDGPLLSSHQDPRVTPFGRIMRRYRLDELPQFINVLKGDMSLVGPRPERQFFVDQIIQKAPHYYLTQRVKPGITSWGMVKYGYADSVDKMIHRLEFDMLYLDNQSVLIDLKILLFTLKPLFKGKGV